MPNTLRLQGYNSLCVTFLGGNEAIINRGAPMILAPCLSDDKYGWDFVLESDLEVGIDMPTREPTTSVPTTTDGSPRLRYLGRDGCNIDQPCNICTGDCDTNDDCLSGLQCFQRAIGDSTRVPGCGVGGPGDIAGADYCYDPEDNGGDRPTGPPVTTPTTPTTPVPTVTTQLLPLQWLGAEGCTMRNPCLVCTGDCDEDDDCRGSFMCYKREVGELTPIPGCQVGGLGDVPGGDYCYDP
ncbi:hypothetical protein ACHAXR_005766, partial [Thalassiosira sp. AJA248-18]